METLVVPEVVAVVVAPPPVLQAKRKADQSLGLLGTTDQVLNLKRASLKENKRNIIPNAGTI